MRWMLLSLFLSVSAQVQAETSYAWGDLHDLGGLSSVRIERCADGPCWARVIYDNPGLGATGS